MYKVFGTVTSRAFRVLWMLEELNQPYELITAKPRTDAVRAVNPAGKIPVLQIDGQTITDSTAIMTYLADKHHGLTFPAGSIERAHQDALTHAILDELDSSLWIATRHSAILPEDQRVPAIAAPLGADFAQGLERLNDRFVGPFLMGDTMTVPDILLVHCLGWGRMMRFDAGSEALRDYSRRMRERPAYLRTQALAQD